MTTEGDWGKQWGSGGGYGSHRGTKLSAALGQIEQDAVPIRQEAPKCNAGRAYVELRDRLRKADRQSFTEEMEAGDKPALHRGET